MEAMKKLDANLVALLTAGVEDDVSPKSDKVGHLDAKLSPLAQLVNGGDKNARAVDVDANSNLCTEQPQPLDLFKSIKAVKLQMEALTLQPEGTKRMELQQSEIRPIFTVECQLSQELIKSVERYDMFNIMQFESEKFQSLTQCTRFGQEAERAVHLQLNAKDNNGNFDDVFNFGRIHFTVWWREPGTCLNEMLGMGVLELEELYKASLLEQCKCITINRRDEHLASIYLKISLQIPNDNLLSSCVRYNCGVVVDSDNRDGDVSDASYKSGANCGATNNNNGSGNANNSIAGYAANRSQNNSNNNNNPELYANNFTVETTKIRLLRGFIEASETRNLQLTDNSVGYTLLCRPFWQEKQVVVSADKNNIFAFQEQFSIINDEKFLKSVEKQNLVLEVQPLNGIVRLPLHQFFIAYRDATIANHLCKSKLPVISIDCWAPIVNKETDTIVGELKCLLAIGSEIQIAHLKNTRGIGAQTFSTSHNNRSQSSTVLLDMLQSALNTPKRTVAELNMAVPDKTFQFSLNIVCARGLPLNPSVGKLKKSTKKNSMAAKRFTPNEPPNTYVTFQAIDCSSNAFKSHEGMVFATNIAEKSTTPRWQSDFHITASAEYLTNPRKRFILNVWKKAATNTAECLEQPTPLDDAIIGFAALNLNVTPNGLTTGGWLNIVDFNGRIVGTLEVYWKPLEDLYKLLNSNKERTSTVTAIVPEEKVKVDVENSVDKVINQFEQSLDLKHLNLSQAIKRKFTELEQISQRLRTRLVNVTGEELDTNSLNNWQPLNMDDFDEQFDLDLRTPPERESPTPPTSQTVDDIKEFPLLSSSGIVDDDDSPKE